MVPRFRSTFSCLENISLNNSEIDCVSAVDPYLYSSPGMESGPVALLLLNLEKLLETSFAVMGLFKGLG